MFPPPPFSPRHRHVSLCEWAFQMESRGRRTALRSDLTIQLLRHWHEIPVALHLPWWNVERVPNGVGFSLCPDRICLKANFYHSTGESAISAGPNYQILDSYYLPSYPLMIINQAYDTYVGLLN